MTDPGLKLPLEISNDDYEVAIRDRDEVLVTSVWIRESIPTVIAEARRLAEIIKAALTADAEKEPK